MIVGASSFSLRNAHHTITPKKYGNAILSKGYAVLVNPTSSVDPVLGTIAPQPPAVKRFRDGDKVDTLSYRNDVDFFSNMLQSDSVSLGGRRAQVERIKSSATGSRRGAVLPESSQTLADKLNEAINFWDEHPSMFQASQADTIETDSPRTNQPGDVDEIKRDLISVAYQLLQSSPSMAIHSSQFRQEMNTKMNAQLSTTLPYEPMPKVERKVNLTSAVSTPEEVNQAEEDGVLLICYVDCSVPNEENVSFCSGFAIQGGPAVHPDDSPGRGELVITCAHEVRAFN